MAKGGHWRKATTPWRSIHLAYHMPISFAARPILPVRSSHPAPCGASSSLTVRSALVRHRETPDSSQGIDVEAPGLDRTAASGEKVGVATKQRRTPGAGWRHKTRGQDPTNRARAVWIGKSGAAAKSNVGRIFLAFQRHLLHGCGAPGPAAQATRPPRPDPATSGLKSNVDIFVTKSACGSRCPGGRTACRCGNCKPPVDAPNREPCAALDQEVLIAKSTVGIIINTLDEAVLSHARIVELERVVLGRVLRKRPEEILDRSLIR
ncbi:hypothetical protein BDY21DRAFT_422389 [Lineolata rhizophorae]|uniref:Uncharacterized protein n=1 Tax=Lineolata rhizophorae TaxID=578093 RepID=A0A6A6NWZ6_9PEZI|nr:hypothetical protein BDY21DRAFT_422389 [Lineolata rhizophorae]